MMRLTAIFIASIFAAVSWLAPLSAHAQFLTDPTPKHRDLKPAQQEPFQQGLAAARQQDWNAALEHFSDAYKINPRAPLVWFNLGLAASKVPGYELPALAYLKAYYLMTPGAENAASISDLVTKLDRAFQLRMGKTLDGLEAIIGDQFRQGNTWVDDELRLLAMANLSMGDIRAAEKILNGHYVSRDGKAAILSPEALKRDNNRGDAQSIGEAFLSVGQVEAAKRYGVAPDISWYLHADRVEDALKIWDGDKREGSNNQKVSDWDNLSCWAYAHQDVELFARISKDFNPISPDYKPTVVWAVNFYISMGQRDNANKIAGAIPSTSDWESERALVEALISGSSLPWADINCGWLYMPEGSNARRWELSDTIALRGEASNKFESIKAYIKDFSRDKLDANAFRRYVANIRYISDNYRVIHCADLSYRKSAKCM